MTDELDQEPEFDLTPHAIKDMKTDPMVLELAMLRVRHRHEEAGDIHKMKFKDLLMEAKAEAKANEEEIARKLSRPRK